jgi:hypothetical protein
MNITVARGSAAAAVLAALLLTGCGSSADRSGDTVAPGAQSTTGVGGNPNEHRGHRDLQSGPAVVSNPNEHLSHLGH